MGKEFLLVIVLCENFKFLWEKLFHLLTLSLEFLFIFVEILASLPVESMVPMPIPPVGFQLVRDPSTGQFIFIPTTTALGKSFFSLFTTNLTKLLIFTLNRKASMK